MIFSSLEFICIFLPIVFIIYCIVPNLKVKNVILIIASLLFYAYGEPVYVILMLCSVCLNYIIGRLLQSRETRRKLILAVGVGINIGVLGVFKYTDFFVENINQAFSVGIPVPHLALPIGISFFTFQAISYIIDVYRRKVEGQKNFLHILLYISFFPQLIAGPIIKYKDIYQAIANRKQTVDQVVAGLCRFAFGLGKKVIIAGAMGEVADAIFSAGNSSINVVVAWVGAIAYMLQIYYDFSGYSDMAIGLGKMFGFQFQENFIYPYGSRSIKEFWRRWHVSLSTWFRDYLYIPLGGNRKGKGRACINRIIVFFCTGFWHGANWTFILWGFWHGLFLLLEEFVPIFQRLPKVISNIYTLLVVCLGFVVFRADNIWQGFYMIKEMFTGFNFTAASESFALQQMTPWFIIMLIVAIIGAAPIRPLADKIRGMMVSDDMSRIRTIVQIAVCIAAAILLCWCIIRLSGNAYNPFIYFRF